MAKRISIINFKGGVGKTTVSYNLAAGLARYHKSKVLLVDVDHQSSLTLVCLNEEQWKKAIEEKRTINSIFKHYTTLGTPIPDKEIIIKKPLGYHYETLDLLASELQLDETELDLGSSGVGPAITAEWDKRMLIANWIEKNGIDEGYDYIIFDCPPATKIVTQNAIAVSHGYIVPAMPDAVSTRGIPHLKERMFKKIDEKMDALQKFLKTRAKKIEKVYVKNTKFLGIIIFRIRTCGGSYSRFTNDHTTHLHRLTRLYKDKIIEPYIEEGVGVAESLNDMHPVYDCSYNYNITNRGYIPVFKKITSECKKLIDSV